LGKRQCDSSIEWYYSNRGVPGKNFGSESCRKKELEDGRRLGKELYYRKPFLNLGKKGNQSREGDIIYPEKERYESKEIGEKEEARR